MDFPGSWRLMGGGSVSAILLDPLLFITFFFLCKMCAMASWDSQEEEAASTNRLNPGGSIHP